MTQQTPLGITVPVITDSPDVPRDVLEVVTDMEPMLWPPFATTTARDTARTSRTFRGCYLAGVPQVQIGTVWFPVVTQRAEMDATGSSPPITLADSTWKVLGLDTTAFSQGSGITRDSSASVGVTDAGRYDVLAQVTWNTQSSVGSRRLGLSTSQTVSPSSLGWLSGRETPQGVGTLHQTFFTRITLAAGASLSLWAYEDAGVALNINWRRLDVRSAS